MKPRVVPSLAFFLVVACGSLPPMGIGADGRAAAVHAKLRSIVVPEVDFRDAALPDVFEFLVQTSRELDKDPLVERRGVNIVLSLSPDEKARTVTFKARQLTLLEVLKTVMQTARVEYAVTGNVIVIRGAGQADSGPIVVRSYKVPFHLISQIRREGAHAYLTGLGMVFTEGASARFNGATGRLVVANTEARLQNLEKILVKLGMFSEGATSEP